ncbi:MAG: GNAT family N-acetyltransferase [Ktedonobacterales bacterium]|nr:GNAT family N-acetyltransferase [Ktedonobacterales bacterium]
MAAAREAPITVRRAGEADRATARGLIPPTTARGRASLTLLDAGIGLLWVAFETAPEGEKLVGLLLATAQMGPESEEPVGYIQELLVHPAYRRRGVAMHLLDAAERYFLTDHAFALVSLVTSPENDAALRLYRSRGYTTHAVRLSKRRPEPPTEEPHALE